MSLFSSSWSSVQWKQLHSHYTEEIIAKSYSKHTFAAYDGAQLPRNALHDTKHYPLGSHGQAGKSTTYAKSAKKGYTGSGTEPNIRANSHIASFIDYPTEEPSQIVYEKNCNATLS